jgi:ligand-binding sensor domain-containing protein
VPDAKGHYQMTAINMDGPPWLLRDRINRTLWQLDHGAQASNPRLTRVEIREGDTTLQSSAAIRWSNGMFLLATERGLRVFDVASKQLTKVDFPEPPQAATTIARDGLGRLWLGCTNGLYVVEPAEKFLEPLDRVPPVRRNEIHALSADPQHADGVIVALGSRGVAFVRVLRKP